MTMVKIYRNLTTKEVGIFKTTEVDKTDGRIHYLLEVKDEQGTPMEKRVLNTTFRRWWKLVEEVDSKDLQKTLNKIYSPDEEVEEEPTIEDLKELNDSGVELTEEELKMFKEQSKEVAKTVVKEKKPVTKKKESTGVVEYFEKRVQEMDGTITEYSEPMKRVVKDKNGKTVIFYMVRPNNAIKIYMKDQIDEVATDGVLAVEQQTYPKQFPFRLEIKELTEQNKTILEHILELFVSL